MVSWGYNQFTNHLLTSWDIQVPVCVLDSSLNEVKPVFMVHVGALWRTQVLQCREYWHISRTHVCTPLCHWVDKIDFCWVGSRGSMEFLPPPQKRNDTGWKAMISEVISYSGPWNSGKPKSPKILLERTSISTSQSDGSLGSFNSFNLQQRWIGQGLSQEHLRWLRCI